MATVQSEREQRVILRNIDWETYQRLLDRRGENAVPRYTYDGGVLEIVSPLLPEHGLYGHDVALLVDVLAEELGLDVSGYSPITLKREDIQTGAEPDACFYIHSEERVRGRRRIDLSVDPPPDLVIEIDITNPSLDKLPIYARLGVHEVWRYDGRSLDIRILEAEGYREGVSSNVFRGMSAEALTGLLEERQGLGSTAWLRRVRRWARELAPPGTS